MRHELRNPYEFHETTFARWKKSQRESISAGDTICQVEWQGELTNVSYWADGFLAQTYASEGQLLQPLHVLAIIVTTANELPPLQTSAAPPSHVVPIAEPGPLQAVPTRRPKLFICYRREDASDAAGRLHDRLAIEYSRDGVFMDIDSVPLGVNFVTHINQHLQGCAAALVMIGRSWTAIADAEGNRRLDDGTDHVRVEVATALKQGILIIPILVQNANMPRAADLPEDIRDLAFYNGMKLTPEFWRTGVERLIKELDRVMKPSGDS